jgi:VacB/RNase II family 3'-5' exoribonuclease
MRASGRYNQKLMPKRNQAVDLRAIARETLVGFGFLVDLPKAAQAQLARLQPEELNPAGARDLTAWLWSSIDNDDSRDLDQLEYVQVEAGGTRVYVAIANVVSTVGQGSPLDKAARHNTTSIYTGVQTFPMLPAKLSEDMTSLLEGEKRLATVVEMLVHPDGEVTESSVYPAVVRNHGQLTYRAVGPWLESQPGDDTEVSNRVLSRIHSDAALQEQLRQQHAAAQALRGARLKEGALTFETIEVRPEPADGSWELRAATRNAATWLIEDFMIAANQATVGFLKSKSFPTLQRVVRTPKNWPHIARLAAQHGTTLPADPDQRALEDFLELERAKNPEGFPDLSLAIIKLLGRGEYVVVTPGREVPGHFGLAVEDYTHSTAPNRRYPDVVTQRLLHAAMEGDKPPYSKMHLADLAAHCTEKENDANKAERSVKKSIAAVVMAGRIGEEFEGMITGASDKGVWVRITHPPVEGRLEGAITGLAVGDRVVAKLVSTDPWRGYIDFDLIRRR